MSAHFQQVLLALVILGAALSTAGVLYSMAFPAERSWPIASPDGSYASTRRFLNRAMGPTFGVSSLLLTVVGVLDFGSLELPPVLHTTAGALLFSSGGAFALAGFRTLGPEISTGTPGDLELRGPYRLSRNPQYVGTVVALLGAGLLANSWFVLVGATAWSSWFLLAPLAEEPWLRSILGAPYEDYLSRTRRYL